MDAGRREILAGAAVALAGCTDVEQFVEAAAGPNGHPLEGETTVAVLDRSGGDLDLDALADEALAFWNENAPQYAGFAVEFRRVESDPDVEIEFLASREDLDGCRDHDSGEVLGCAPLLETGHRLDRPATAEVVAGSRPYGDVRVTTQHELGHLLGLDHDDEPAYVMSNRIEDRLPEYESRVEILNAFETLLKTQNEGTRTYNEGMAHWNDGDHDAAVDPFERAAERYRSLSGYLETAETAVEAFDDMKRPETVDRERLQSYLETTRTVIRLSVDLAEAMLAASKAMVDGNRFRAQDHQDDAENAKAELDATDAPSPAAVGRALGLIREEETSSGNAESPAET